MPKEIMASASVSCNSRGRAIPNTRSCTFSLAWSTRFSMPSRARGWSSRAPWNLPLDGSSGRAHYLPGLALLAVGRRDEALPHLRSAAADFPNARGAGSEAAGTLSPVPPHETTAR